MTEIFDAIENGQFDQFKSLIGKDNSLLNTTIYKEEYTLLHISACKNIISQ